MTREQLKELYKKLELLYYACKYDEYYTLKDKHKDRKNRHTIKEVKQIVIEKLMEKVFE